jgi:hypothetical protein
VSLKIRPGCNRAKAPSGSSLVPWQFHLYNTLNSPRPHNGHTSPSISSFSRRRECIQRRLCSYCSPYLSATCLLIVTGQMVAWIQTQSQSLVARLWARFLCAAQQTGHPPQTPVYPTGFAGTFPQTVRVLVLIFCSGERRVPTKLGRVRTA